MTLLVTVNEAEEDQTGAPDMKAVIAVVGLAIEARIAGTAAMIADGDRTAFLLRDAVQQGVRGIISFGVCGGLDPKLRPGKVVIASSVLAGLSAGTPCSPKGPAQPKRRPRRSTKSWAVARPHGAQADPPPVQSNLFVS